MFARAPEDGFTQSVVELLTHTSRTDESIANPVAASPGRYHCAMTFKESIDNLLYIEDMLTHESAAKLHRAYKLYEPISPILNRLVASGDLSESWLRVREFGEFV